MAKKTTVATFTLNHVRYSTFDGQTELAVVDLTITDSGSGPFDYSEDSVVFAYPDEDKSWTHQNDDHIYGPNPTENYTPYLPPAPLRAGTLAPGRSVRGLVILRMSPDSNYLLYYSTGTVDLAEWQLSVD